MKFKVVKRCQEDLGSIHELLKSFLPFARKRMGFNRPPTIFFQSDQGNAQKLLGKTAHYEPATGHITVYVTGRHPKDVLRSLSHELVHHGQNCRGEFGHTPDTAPGYAQTDSHMRDMEEEAYKVGNLCFRDWEDDVKSGKIRISMPLKESLLREKKEKYTIVSGDTLSKIAADKYGNAEMWPAIYKANKKVIGDNPDLIYPDTEIIIPDASEYSELSQEEIDSIYKKTGSGGRQGPALNIAETDALFPVRKEDRPGRITPYGNRAAIKSLVRKSKRYSKSHFHGGIDVGVPIGTDIIAPVSGKISAINARSKSGGKIMYLKGDDGRRYEFMHLDSFVASKGEQVVRGQVIAKSGNTGFSTGPHLHFQVREGGKLIDPMMLYGSTNIQSINEWKSEELNKLLLKKFNLGVKK